MEGKDVGREEGKKRWIAERLDGWDHKGNEQLVGAKKRDDIGREHETALR